MLVVKIYVQHDGAEYRGHQNQRCRAYFVAGDTKLPDAVKCGYVVVYRRAINKKPINKFIASHSPQKICKLKHTSLEYKPVFTKTCPSSSNKTETLLFE